MLLTCEIIKNVLGLRDALYYHALSFGLQSALDEFGHHPDEATTCSKEGTVVMTWKDPSKARAARKEMLESGLYLEVSTEEGTAVRIKLDLKKGW